MADSKKQIEFKDKATGTVFEATLESYAAPEASWYQWVAGLPESLRKPGVSFHTTKGSGMFSLTVGESTKTGAIVTRADGAVLCQITGMVAQSVIDDFVAQEEGQTKDNMRRFFAASGHAPPEGVAERPVYGESPLTGAVGAFNKAEKKP